MNRNENVIMKHLGINEFYSLYNIRMQQSLSFFIILF